MIVQALSRRNGEKYITICTDSHALATIATVIGWSQNQELSLTDSEAGKFIQGIVDEFKRAHGVDLGRLVDAILGIPSQDYSDDQGDTTVDDSVPDLEDLELDFSQGDWNEP